MQLLINPTSNEKLNVFLNIILVQVWTLYNTCFLYQQALSSVEVAWEQTCIRAHTLIAVVPGPTQTNLLQAKMGIISYQACLNQISKIFGDTSVVQDSRMICIGTVPTPGDINVCLVGTYIESYAVPPLINLYCHFDIFSVQIYLSGLRVAGSQEYRWNYLKLNLLLSRFDYSSCLSTNR